MLELAGQCGFREYAQPHASTPGIPGNVEGAGFFAPLGRNAGLSEGGRNWLRKRNRSPLLWSPGKLGAQGFGRPAQRGIPPITAGRRCCGELTTH